MSEKEVLITVVTICYNAVSEIENTILSVINQSYDNIEYIVIDGHSNDGTVDVIKKYQDRITKWVSEPDKGIYDAMNKGISLATGKYINFMNAGDCFYDNDVVSNISKYTDKNATIIYGNTLMRYPSYNIVTKPFPIEDLSWHMAFGHQSSFISLDYQKSHPYSLKYRSSSDYDFFYHAYMDNVSFYYVDLLVANYEATKGVSSVSFKLVENEMADILGVNTNLAWRINLEIRYLWYCIKQKIKTCLPASLVKNIKIWNLNR